MENGTETLTGVLVLEDNTSDDVARALIAGGRQKEPFYIFDMDEAYRRIEYFRKSMPRIEIFYAMKSNDSDKMIKLVASQGLSFDCASPGEIRKALKLGVSPKSIILAVPTKTVEWMTYACASGVRHTTFDSSDELKKIKQYWPDARLLIRIKVDNECSYTIEDKFGCDFQTEAIELLEEASALDLKVVGVAFHVGSYGSSIESYVDGLQKARALFDHEAKAGRKMSIVDIGGGFKSDRIDRIDQVSKVINSTLEELFPDPSVQIIAEPGRYICDTAFKLYCSISNIRRVARDGKPITMIYLNTGLYGTLRRTQAWHTVKRFETSAIITKEELEEVILWGPSCDSNDRVMKENTLYLPRCSPVDWLVFTTQGAYTTSMATPFSCLQKPQIRSVISQKLWKQIKDSKAFDPKDFEENADISTPLPSTLPPLVKNTSFVNSYTLI